MKPTDYAVLHAIRARAARCRLGYGGRAWVTSDPKSEVVEDRMWLLEYIDQEARATNRLRDQLQIAADSFRNLGCAVDADDCEEAINESLSGGNPGESKACTPAEKRGIVGATGAGQPPDGNPESTGDSADRRSPDDTTGPSSPDESNRHFERGCHVIMELMQAYERRVRSDCTTQEQLDKRPWECAEYIKAAEYLRKVWPPHEPQGWQPIETAPRDTPILLSIFASGDPERERLVVVGGSSDGVTWIDHYDYEIHPPTHWMSLPSAPSTKSGEQT